MTSLILEKLRLVVLPDFTGFVFTIGLITPYLNKNFGTANSVARKRATEFASCAPLRAARLRFAPTRVTQRSFFPKFFCCAAAKNSRRICCCLTASLRRCSFHQAPDRKVLQCTLGMITVLFQQRKRRFPAKNYALSRIFGHSEPITPL